jgi:hypothetical protein
VSTTQTPKLQIGDILIEQGVLSEQQVFEILDAQRRVGKPFGVLAEEMFEVAVDTVERAWVEQYGRLTGELDLEAIELDERVLELLNRRQAWQFELLPLRYEPGGELLVAASRTRLARAVSFAAHRLPEMVYFRIARSGQLRKFLQKHYPMPEVTQEVLRLAKRYSREA